MGFAALSKATGSSNRVNNAPHGRILPLQDLHNEGGLVGSLEGVIQGAELVQNAACSRTKNGAAGKIGTSGKRRGPRGGRLSSKKVQLRKIIPRAHTSLLSLYGTSCAKKERKRKTVIKTRGSRSAKKERVHTSLARAQKEGKRAGRSPRRARARGSRGFPRQ